MADPTSAPLPRCAPEAQGIPSAAILDLVDALAELDSVHSLMVLRHGQVVAEGWWTPYAPAEPHMLFSLSKSFTSTAAGLAIAEGRLSLDDEVLPFFPADAPAEVSEHLARMRVRHLLSMSTGHGEDTLTHLRRAAQNWPRTFLAQPVEFEPGTHFLYNSGATYLVSAIVQRVTGQKVVDYLQPRLFGPLGIDPPAWDCCPQGVNTGGWGLNLKTEDIARFGQLLLQDGVWQGQRLLPAGWVAEATRKHVDNGSDPNNDWNQGYGFQFWRCRHGIYRGDGAFGQFCVVMPEQATVVAMTAGLGDLQGVLNRLWDRLLPALGSAPLPADPAAEERLRERLASLLLPTPQGAVTSPRAAELDRRTFRFATNEAGFATVTIDLASREIRAVTRRGLLKAPFGTGGAWVRGTTRWGGPDPQPVAGSAAWTAADTFTIKLCYYRTPFCPTLTCRLDGDRLELTQRVNVSFGPAEQFDLVGRADGPLA